MIPSFLRAVAAQVRQLVQAKRAVHVTETDAVELEMIAGLAWDSAPSYQWWGSVSVNAAELCGGPDEMVSTLGHEECDITPADIALGWLRCSLAVVAESSEMRFDQQCERAAVCAELAVIAMRCSTQVAFAPRLTEQTKTEAQKILGSLGTGAMLNLPKSFDVEAIGIDPHAGTLEGARAAWDFLATQLAERLPEPKMLGIGLRAGGKTQLLTDMISVADKYRRELEALNKSPEARGCSWCAQPAVRMTDGYPACSAHGQAIPAVSGSDLLRPYGRKVSE